MFFLNFFRAVNFGEYFNFNQRAVVLPGQEFSKIDLSNR
jgi:hypothetical protein